MKPYKIVLTGGPASGKTTVANSLQNKGFVVVPEVSRFVMERGLYPRVGAWTPEWQLGFQEFIAKIQRAVEKSYRDEPLILDQGIYDSIGYMMTLFPNLAPEQILGFLSEVLNGDLPRYDAALILETIAKNKKKFKNLRPNEDPDFALRVHENIKKGYKFAHEKGFVKNLYFVNSSDLSEKQKLVYGMIKQILR